MPTLSQTIIKMTDIALFILFIAVYLYDCILGWSLLVGKAENEEGEYGRPTD